MALRTKSAMGGCLHHSALSCCIYNAEGGLWWGTRAHLVWPSSSQARRVPSFLNYENPTRLC